MFYLFYIKAALHWKCYGFWKWDLSSLTDIIAM